VRAGHVGMAHRCRCCSCPQKNIIQVELQNYFESTDVSIITHANAVLSEAHQALIGEFIKETADVD
jgi:hypothetical protein